MPEWIKASERLSVNLWQGKFRDLRDNSLREFRGIHELDKGRFRTGGYIIASRLVEWFDETESSSASDKEMEELIGWILLKKFKPSKVLTSKWLLAEFRNRSDTSKVPNEI